MDERKKKVLAAIIQDYVITAEPVGSRTLARKYNLGVSPATIRNEMADLEEMGYIEQPHTSAGRIPSDRGYRYFVDRLMDKGILSPEEVGLIHERFARKMEEMEQILQQAANLLSEITSYTALMLRPQTSFTPVRHIQLLPIEPGKALLVVVINSNVVEHRLQNIPVSITRQDLERISHVLNSKLKGVDLEQVCRATLDDIYHEFSKEKLLLKAVESLLAEMTHWGMPDKVYVGGVMNIFDQPEFRDIVKVKTLLNIFDDSRIVRELLQEPSQPGLTIRIGGENKHKDIAGCSLVTASCQLDGQIVGTLGVLGPTRMDYSKASSLVEYVARSLSKVLSGA